MNRSSVITIIGWFVAIVATIVYLFTLEPSVSFWDCGEFIATSYLLEVGHPPGAPLYSLLAHCFTLLASNPEQVAWWSNALSAVAGGLTAMFLFWTICRLLCNHDSSTDNGIGRGVFAAIVGTFCYVFCDTAWFSAVESEVYGLSMLFSSAIVWAMVRWAQSIDRSPRWLFLIAFLLGLSVCVHQLSLLTIPALLVIYFTQRKKYGFQRDVKSAKKNPIFNILFLILFFLIGLTPYLIIPIRAAADPPINMGAPSTREAFHDYFTRSQYEKAPLFYGRCYNSPIVAFDDDGKPVYAPEMNMFFPRMWKRGTYSDLYYNDWCGRHGKMVNVDGQQYYKPSQGDNLIIFGGYQLGYMYLRYLMWNFSGRYNDRQGYGNLQKGQFITGIPFIDRLYIGTSAAMPDSMPSAGHNRYFLLPLILGIIGLFSSFGKSGDTLFGKTKDARPNQSCSPNNKQESGHDDKQAKCWAWSFLTLFLISSLALSVYLNHPMYEPRERDYAYILSFYTFAIWIAFGAKAIISFIDKKFPVIASKLSFIYSILLVVPLLMAFQNWDDHDRSGRFIARDVARNILESCDQNALLFTLGDNDTFPLWYLQEVENCRPNVQVINISLLGSESYALSIAKQLVAKDEKSSSDDSQYSILSSQLLNAGPYRRMMAIINLYNGKRTPHFSHYAKNDQRVSFDCPLQLSGFVYRLPENTQSSDSVDLDRCHRLMSGALRWESLDGVYIDETSHGFLRQYWLDVILAAENLADAGRQDEACQILDSTRSSIPLRLMCDPQLTYKASQAYGRCGDSKTASSLAADCRYMVKGQLEYYSTMSPGMQYYISYTIDPLKELQQKTIANTH